jgi:hypothetical protein
MCLRYASPTPRLFVDSSLRMETKLSNPSPARRHIAALLGVLAVAVAVPVFGPALVQADSIAPVTTGGTSATGTTGTTGATADPNDYTCTGKIGHGTPEAGVSGTQVSYRFSCNGPITGYQIETEPHQIQYYDASPTVTSTTSATPATDGFECEGAIPGVAIDCVSPTGLTGASVAGEVIVGQFTIAGKLYSEPRLDAILTVTDATATATASAPSITVKAFGSTGSTTVTPKVTVTGVAVVDAISGPFDLGRPDDVTPDAFNHDTRLGSNPPQIVLTAKQKNGDVITTAEPKSGPPAPKP